MNRKNILIGIVALIVVGGIAAYQFGGALPVSLPGREVASSTEEVVLPGEGGATTTKPSTSQGGVKPTIPTSPYTVYFGMATKYGTSSPELMNQEGSLAVVGYEWEAIYPSPMFDSVSLPQWGAADAEYEVYTWDEEVRGYVLLGEFTSGKEIQFPRDQLNGPRKFKVTGINSALKVCPGDRSFNWIFRLTFEGTMNIIRTPITQPLPVSQTCEMR